MVKLNKAYLKTIFWNNQFFGIRGEDVPVLIVLSYGAIAFLAAMGLCSWINELHKPNNFISGTVTTPLGGLLVSSPFIIVFTIIVINPLLLLLIDKLNWWMFEKRVVPYNSNTKLNGDVK